MPANACPAAATRLVLGLGCDRNTPSATLLQGIALALRQLGASAAQVQAAASIDLKADEPCILQLPQHHPWPLHFYSAAQLARVPVPNPSEVVRRYTGTPSVSESAALLLAGGGVQAAPVAALLVEKYRLRGADGKNVTVSIACVPTLSTLPTLPTLPAH